MPKRQQYESDGGFVDDAPKTKKAKSGGNELKKTEGKATVSTEMQTDDEGNEYWEVSKPLSSRRVINPMLSTPSRSRAPGVFRYRSSRARPWSIYENSTRKTESRCRARRYTDANLRLRRPSMIISLSSTHMMKQFAWPDTVQGISLSIDQFTAVLDILPELERTLKSKGITIPRPEYDRAEVAPGTANDGDHDEGAAEVDEAPVETKSTSKLSKFMHKPNHEATSDEDEE